MLKGERWLIISWNIIRRKLVFLYFGTDFKRQRRQWKKGKLLASKSLTAERITACSCKFHVSLINNVSIWVYFGVYLNFIDLLCLRHNGKFVVALYLSDLPKWTVLCSTLFFDRIFCQVLPSWCKMLSSTWKDEMNCVISSNWPTTLPLSENYDTFAWGGLEK